MTRFSVPLLLASLVIAACDDGGGGADADMASLDMVSPDMASLDMTPHDTGASDMVSLDMAPDDMAPDDMSPPDMAVDYDIPPAPALPERGPCDDSRPPVVMAHGFLASGDTWSAHVARFVANGHCADRYHAFDWNTLAMDADHAGALDAFIDDVRAAHGVEQVDLMGHSAGGRLGYDYLADPARAAKVRRYVHTGSFPNDGPPGPPGAPVDTLNLWSDADLIVPGAVIPGTTDGMIPGIDHYAIATDPAAFERVYAFLYETPPATTERASAEVPIVGGRVMALGENTPTAGAVVDVWALDPATGMRVGGAPRARFVAEDDGAWGPFAAERGVPYELHVRPAGGGRVVRYYRPPFTGDDPLVYLRTLPGPGSVAGALLTQVRFTAESTVLVVFSSTRALDGARDVLTIDGASVLTPALAPPEETLIALFVYDQGGDGQPGTPNAIFGQFPFLQMVDLPIAADPMATTTLTLGAQTLRVPRWPGAPEGAVIAVFDPTAEPPAE